MIRIVLLCVFINLNLKAQTFNLNNPFFEESLRRAQLNGDIDSSISFTLRPIDISSYEINKNVVDLELYSPTVLSFFKEKGKIKIFSSHSDLVKNSCDEIIKLI